MSVSVMMPTAFVADNGQAADGVVNHDACSFLKGCVFRDGDDILGHDLFPSASRGNNVVVDIEACRRRGRGIEQILLRDDAGN